MGIEISQNAVKIKDLQTEESVSTDLFIVVANDTDSVAKKTPIKKAISSKVDNSIYTDGDLSKANRNGDVLYGILDKYTGEDVTLSKVASILGDVDNVIYFKVGDEFFVRNYSTPVNVKWFGEIGFGNDSDIFQKAVNVTEEILVPTGHYTITTPVVTDKPIKISGEVGSKIKFSTSAFIVKDDIQIYGVEFETDLSTTTNAINLMQIPDGKVLNSVILNNIKFNSISHPIRMTNTTSGAGINNLNIDNCYINSCNLGIELKGTLNHVNITNVVIDGAITGGMYVGDNIKANQDLYQKITVKNCVVKNVINTVQCIGILVYGRDVIIDGNFVDNLKNDTGEDCEGIYTKVRYGLITNNICRNAGCSEGAINVKGTYRDEPTGGPNGYAVVVTNNQVVYTEVLPGIMRQGINMAAEDVLMANNIVTGATGPAYHTRTHNGRNFFIYNNLARQCDATASSTPWIFSVRTCGSNVRMEGNTVDECLATSAFMLENRQQEYLSKLENIIISKNIVSNFNGNGLRIVAHSPTGITGYNTFGAISISENIFQDVAVGIDFATTIPNTTIDSLTIIGNVFKEVSGTVLNGITGALNVSTFKIIDNNIGYTPIYPTPSINYNREGYRRSFVIQSMSNANLQILKFGTFVPTTNNITIRLTVTQNHNSASSGGMLVKTYNILTSSGSISSVLTNVDFGNGSIQTMLDIKAPVLDINNNITIPMFLNSTSRSLSFDVEIFGVATAIDTMLPLSWSTSSGSFEKGTYPKAERLGIGLPGNDMPTESLDVVGKGKLTDDFEITTVDKGVILKDVVDGSRRRITINNGVLVVSSAL